MATDTKELMAGAMRELMATKPVDKITIKDIVEKCGVNRQTFYYHFEDADDLLEWIFEEDAGRVLPTEVSYDRWEEDVMKFFRYLVENRTFALNVYNSNSRLYMLRFYSQKLEKCVRDFAEIVSEGKNISRQDFDFVVSFYTEGIVGLISRWLDYNMELPKTVTFERFIQLLCDSVENMLSRFEMDPRT